MRVRPCSRGRRNNQANTSFRSKNRTGGKEMNDPIVLVGVAVVAIAAGFGVGFFARSMWASTAIRTAQDKSARILAEARAQQKELILQAKDEQVRLAREGEEDARAR